MSARLLPLAAVMLVVACDDSAYHSEWVSRRTMEYNAWVKLTGRGDITEDEYWMLRRAGHLESAEAKARRQQQDAEQARAAAYTQGLLQGQLLR